MKFDPISNPEMATGVDVLGSAFFHTLGYNVPENYLVTFDEDRLVIGDGTTLVDVGGRKRPLSRSDVTEMMLKIPRDAQGRVRGVASYFLKGKFLGNFGITVRDRMIPMTLFSTSTVEICGDCLYSAPGWDTTIRAASIRSTPWSKRTA